MEYLLYFSIDDITKILGNLKKERLERLENVNFEELDYFKKNAKADEVLGIKKELVESFEKLLSIYITAALFDYKEKGTKRQDIIQELLDSALQKMPEDVKQNYEKINADSITITMANDEDICEEHRPDIIELFNKVEVNDIFEKSLAKIQSNELFSLFNQVNSNQMLNGFNAKKETAEASNGADKIGDNSNPNKNKSQGKKNKK